MTIREAANGIEINDWTYLVGFNGDDETIISARDIEELEEVWRDLSKEFEVPEDCVDYIEGEFREVKAYFSLCDGKYCNGFIKVSADNYTDAYYAATDEIGRRLNAAFPDIDIEYSVKIVTEED